VPTIAISQSNETGGSPTTDARKQIKNDGYPSADRRITNAGAPIKLQSPRRLYLAGAAIATTKGSAAGVSDHLRSIIVGSVFRDWPRSFESVRSQASYLSRGWRLSDRNSMRNERIKSSYGHVERAELGRDPLAQPSALLDKSGSGWHQTASPPQIG
jgi:hypothetical protein